MEHNCLCITVPCYKEEEVLPETCLLYTSDAVYMAENAVYSILSPEGFASILWKDSSRAAEAAELMKMTAPELYQMGVVDKLLPEKETGGIEGPRFKKEVLAFLETYGTIDAEALVSRR